MTYPKMKPCPRCGASDHLAVYSYESGGRHVECDKCHYLGPPSGSIRNAIKLHNERSADLVTSPALRSDTDEAQV